METDSEQQLEGGVEPRKLGPLLRKLLACLSYPQPLQGGSEGSPGGSEGSGPQSSPSGDPFPSPRAALAALAGMLERRQHGLLRAFVLEPPRLGLTPLPQCLISLLGSATERSPGAEFGVYCDECVSEVF